MSETDNPKKVRIIIKDVFSGKQTSMELFSDILIAELRNDWTKDKQGDIMKPPTDPNSCCWFQGGNHETT